MTVGGWQRPEPLALGTGGRAAGPVYLAAAIAYFVAVEALGVTFDATPLLVAIAMMAAGVVRGRFPGAALPLASWGIAVLLVRHGPLADEREAPAFIVALAIGIALLVLLKGTRLEIDLATAVMGTAAVMAFGGVAFYLGFAYGMFLDAWFWALALAAAGVLHLVFARPG